MRFHVAVLWIAVSSGLSTLATAQAANPPVYLYSNAKAEFDQSVKPVLFPWNVDDSFIDPSPIEANAQWLKEHPDIYFFVEGYASTRGELVYNLALSQRRADNIKQHLIALGVPENRILLAVGWGQLYPVCPEENEDCWSKNRRVTLAYGHQ